jgi:hypothetical protein
MAPTNGQPDGRLLGLGRQAPPRATIYSAILRDMQKNGQESCFRKAGRGLFAMAQ